MQIVSVVILFILFLLIPIGVNLYIKRKGKTKKSMRSHNTSRDINHFDRIYQKNVFSAIKHDSAIAGKWNSPFVPDRDIIDIANSGINLIGGKQINLFENAGDFNERPKW